MTINYTTAPSTAPSSPPRDSGVMLCAIRPENVLHHISQQGWDSFTVGQVAEWMIANAPAAARLTHPVDEVIAVERSLATEFLKSVGKLPRVEATDRLSVDAVHQAVVRLSGQKIAVSRVQEWADLPGFGRPFFSQYFPATQLDTVAASVALAFMRHAGIARKS